jgi:hypothetical protein
MDCDAELAVEKSPIASIIGITLPSLTENPSTPKTRTPFLAQISRTDIAASRSIKVSDPCLTALAPACRINSSKEGLIYRRTRRGIA